MASETGCRGRGAGAWRGLGRQRGAGLGGRWGGEAGHGGWPTVGTTSRDPQALLALLGSMFITLHTQFPMSMSELSYIFANG